MYFRRAANETSYVFKYRRFNYVMLCVECIRDLLLTNFNQIFRISTGFCSVEYWLDLCSVGTYLDCSSSDRLDLDVFLLNACDTLGGYSKDSGKCCYFQNFEFA